MNYYNWFFLGVICSRNQKKKPFTEFIENILKFDLTQSSFSDLNLILRDIPKEGSISEKCFQVSEALGKVTLDKEPRNSDALSHLLSLACMRGDEKSIQEFSQKLLNLDTLPANECVQTGQLLIACNKTDLAESFYTKAKEIEPTNPVFRYFIFGFLNLHKRDFPTAIDLFEQYSIEKARDANGRIFAGFFSTVIGDNVRAEKNAVAGIKIEPENPRLLFVLGTAQLNTQQYGLASKNFEQSLVGNPHNDHTYVSILNNLGLAYWYLRQVKKAEKNWLLALKGRPDQEMKLRLQYLLGRLYLEQNQLNMAKKYLSCIRESNDPLIEHWEPVIRLMNTQGNFKESHKVLKELSKKNSNNQILGLFTYYTYIQEKR